MEIVSRWIEKNKFEVENGRHPAIVLDTPEKYGGEDSVPTALELAIMSLAGCLGTTFNMTLQKMRLQFKTLEIKAAAKKREEIFLESIHIIVNVKSGAEVSKLERALTLAEKNCPVDNIFQQTKIPITVELQIS